LTLDIASFGVACLVQHPNHVWHHRNAPNTLSFECMARHYKEQTSPTSRAKGLARCCVLRSRRAGPAPRALSNDEPRFEDDEALPPRPDALPDAPRSFLLVLMISSNDMVNAGFAMVLECDVVCGVMWCAMWNEEGMAKSSSRAMTGL
jgi:hypothetical protein